MRSKALCTKYKSLRKKLSGISTTGPIYINPHGARRHILKWKRLKVHPQIATQQATRQPDHRSNALLLQETKADLTLTHHTCRQPASDALVSQLTPHLRSRGSPEWPMILSTHHDSAEPIVRLATCSHAGTLLGLFFDSEDGGDICFRNVYLLSMDYIALYPTRRFQPKITFLFLPCFPTQWFPRSSDFAPLKCTKMVFTAYIESTANCV
jgi:hypothetical protein